MESIWCQRLEWVATGDVTGGSCRIDQKVVLPYAHGRGEGRPLIFYELSAVSVEMHQLWMSEKGKYGLVKLTTFYNLNKYLC